MSTKLFFGSPSKADILEIQGSHEKVSVSERRHRAGLQAAAFVWLQNISACGATVFPLCEALVHLLSLASAVMINDTQYDAALKPNIHSMFLCFHRTTFYLHILRSGVVLSVFRESGAPVFMLGHFVELQRRKQVFHRKLMKAFHPRSLMRD